MSNLTQDDLRQLYEAGASFVKERKWFPITLGVPPATAPSSIEYELNLRQNETLVAALVGYATQLSDEVYPNDRGCVVRDSSGTASIYFTNAPDLNYVSLTALIVDLARMKKERGTEKKTYGIGILAGGGVVAAAPESVTATEILSAPHPSDPHNRLVDIVRVIEERVGYLEAQFNQLRADVREIAEATAIIARHLDRLPPSNQIILAIERLRKVVERND